MNKVPYHTFCQYTHTNLAGQIKSVECIPTYFKDYKPMAYAVFPPKDSEQVGGDATMIRCFHFCFFQFGTRADFQQIPRCVSIESRSGIETFWICALHQLESLHGVSSTEDFQIATELYISK